MGCSGAPPGPNDLGPESIPFVFELGDSIAKAAILDEGCRCGGWIDEALRTLSEAGTTCARAFRVRGPRQADGIDRGVGGGAPVVQLTLVAYAEASMVFCRRRS